jgi:hypothetical protein
MYLNGEQMDVIRKKAGQLIDAYVPFKWGEPKSKEVCPTYGGPGAGTTCGFLCHFLLWRLGVKDAWRVNWNDPGRGLTATPGENIMRIYRNGAAPFVRCASTDPQGRVPNPLNRGVRPRLGDIVFLYRPGGQQSDEHVFVFVKEEGIGTDTIWHTAEAGQPGAKGSTDARPRQRWLVMPDARAGSDAPVKVDETQHVTFDLRRGSNRTVIGWLDIGQLDYTDTAFDDAKQPVQMVV